MKKAKALLLPCAALTMVSILAFANNVVAIVNWWKMFIATGGNTEEMSAHVPGFLPWLDWSAVDYSAVTTFIPAIGLFFMTKSLFDIIRGKRVNGDDFPFFRGSDQLHIALGLFGTLWGIIVIGFFDLDSVSMADLMQCLHTALFSTLMAVVWVFMIDRPLVRPFFVKMLAESNLAEETDGDLTGAVDRLIARIGEACDSFAKHQKEYEATMTRRHGEYEALFESRHAQYEEEFEKRNRRFEEEFGKRHDEYAASFEKRLADYEKEFDARQKEYVEFFRRQLDELQKRAEASEAKLKAVIEAIHG